MVCQGSMADREQSPPPAQGDPSRSDRLKPTVGRDGLASLPREGSTGYHGMTDLDRESRLAR